MVNYIYVCVCACVRVCWSTNCVMLMPGDYVSNHSNLRFPEDYVSEPP